MKNLIIGIVGSVFYIWAIWASGIEYFLLCLTVYIIGIFFYYKARKELGAEKVFNGKELIVAAVILAGAIAAIVMLITGQITINVLLCKSILFVVMCLADIVPPQIFGEAPIFRSLLCLPASCLQRQSA